MSSFNNYDFQSVSNNTNQNNHDIRTECLKDINEPTQLHQFYNQESVYNRPPIYVCRDKLEKMNNDINYHITDSRPIYNSSNKCQKDVEIPFNVRNQKSAGSYLHDGYSDGIDVDSHLKGINVYQDCCFNDQYKINPKTISCKDSRLAYYADVLCKDYDKPSKESVRDAYSRNYRVSNKCLTNEEIQKFDPCPNEIKDEGQNKEPVQYRFTNDTFCKDWPCQKLFYNSTRRSTINRFPHTHSGKDINPKNVYCKPPYQHPTRCDGTPNPLYKSN